MQTGADKVPLLQRQKWICCLKPNQCKHSNTQYVCPNSMATSLHQISWLNADDVRELEGIWEFEWVSLLCQQLHRKKTKILCEWLSKGASTFISYAPSNFFLHFLFLCDSCFLTVKCFFSSHKKTSPIYQICKQPTKYMLCNVVKSCWFVLKCICKQPVLYNNTYINISTTNTFYRTHLITLQRQFQYHISTAWHVIGSTLSKVVLTFIWTLLFWYPKRKKRITSIND